MSGEQRALQLHDIYPELDTAIPARYLSKLNQNYYPWSREETKEVGDYATKIYARAAEVSDEMAVLKRRIKELKSKNARLETLKSPYQALASAARRLPDPVLRSIFIHCLPTTRNAVMDDSEAPLLLGRICRRWRTVAYSTPQLWASLHIAPPHIPPGHAKRTEHQYVWKSNAIKAWLGRSGMCPLSISFVWFGESVENVIRLNQIIFQALVPFSKRWVELDVQAPSALLQPLYQLASADFSMLRKLGFTGRRGMDLLPVPPYDVIHPELDAEMQYVTRLIGGAALLEELSLSFNISNPLPLTAVPWTQLKALYLESNILFFFRDFGQMLEVLAQCQNLHSLSLKYPINETDQLPPFTYTGSSITLTNLETLCVDGDQHLDNTFAISKTLLHLITPKLRDLTIMGRVPRIIEGSESPAPSSEVLDGVKALLQASHNRLKSLKLETVNVRSPAFLQCLGLCPFLETLTASAYSPFCPHTDPEAPRPDLPWSDDDLLGLMTPKRHEDGGVEVILPFLKTFDYTLTDIDETTFRRFVESRSIKRLPWVSQLKSLRGSLSGKETKEMKDWVAEINASGTDLSLIYHSRYVPAEQRNPSPWTGVSMNDGTFIAN